MEESNTQVQRKIVGSKCRKDLAIKSRNIATLHDRIIKRYALTKIWIKIFERNGSYSNNLIRVVETNVQILKILFSTLATTLEEIRGRNSLQEKTQDLNHVDRPLVKIHSFLD